MNNDYNEEALVERARNGDPDAFGELVVRYAPSVTALAYQHVGDWETARDISQTALLKAYRNIRSLRTSRSFRAWLFRIAINESADFIRLSRTRKETRLETGNRAVEGVATREERPLERLVAEEERVAVVAALDELPPRQRTVFVLRHFHGLSNAEIAETLSSTSNAVKVNLSYALKSLREKLAGGSDRE
jgi:RNA polymerase sigma-70 factor (ECF subfamily)